MKKRLKKWLITLTSAVGGLLLMFTLTGTVSMAEPACNAASKASACITADCTTAGCNTANCSGFNCGTTACKAKGCAIVSLIAKCKSGSPAALDALMKALGKNCNLLGKTCVPANASCTSNACK